MDLIIYTDGGAINNPGPAASAYLIFSNNKPVAKGAKKIGPNTNNVAEYSALIMALTKAKEIVANIKPKKITCFSDSSLMVNQINGLFKIKNTNLRSLLIKIRELEQEIYLPIFYKYIPREKNTLADDLVKKALSS